MTTAPHTEQHIVALVDRFYDRVRADPVLGPVFNPALDAAASGSANYPVQL